MKCSTCQRDNDAGAKFCEECGTKLLKVCLACGIELNPVARFCPACGVRIPTTQSETSPSPSSPAEPVSLPVDHCSPFPASLDGERRQLTVMFVDLVGATSLSGRLDPEALREILRAYQSICAESIQRFGGHVQQYAGDGVFAYFGYPAAFDDAARRTVLAGLALLAAMEELAIRICATYGVEIQARVGVHTGIVVVGEMGAGETRESGAIVGETPNIAARVQSVARPGTLVLSASTHSLIEPWITVRAIGRHQLKGVAEPIELFEALDESVRPEKKPGSAQSGPLLGRDLELRTLLQRWETAKTGTGHVTLISGEGGIGKSRLLTALHEHVLADGSAWRSLRCSPFYQNSALNPMIDLLERGMAAVPDGEGEDRLGRLRNLLRPYGMANDATVDLFASLLSIHSDDQAIDTGLSPDQRKKNTLASMMAWLAADAQRQPLVLVVEDLHWVDASTRELLGLVLQQIATMPVLALFTFRPEFVPTWPVHSHMSTMPLGRLVRSEIEALALATTGGRALPLPVLDEIVARTDGVPLFVEELCRALLATGVILEREGRLELSRSLKGTEIPATLRDSLTARLDRLGDATAVAQLASVLGRDFSYSLMRAVSDLLDDELEAQLLVLTRAEILLQRGTPPNARYTFKHALIQEAAYDTLLKSRRQQYHRRTAETYLARFPDEARSTPEVVALHFTRAAMPAQAIAYWQKAGELAVLRSGYTEAIGHCTSALELIDLQPPSTVHLGDELLVRLKLGSALIALKGMGAAEVGSNYTRACEIAGSLGDSPERFMAFWGDWLFKTLSGRIEEGATRANDLVILSARLGDPGLVLQAHHSRWTNFLLLGDASIARNDTQQGIFLYDRELHHDHKHIFGGHDPGVCARGTGALSSWLSGFPDEAEHLAEDAVALARELAHPFSMASGFWMASYTLMCRGDYARCVAIAEELVELSRRHHFRQTIGQGLMLCGIAHFENDDRAYGLKLLDEGLEECRKLGQRAYLPPLLCLAAEKQAAVGDNAKALALIQEALEMSSQTNQGLFLSEMLRVRTEIAFANNQMDVHTVCRQLESAIALAREQFAVALEWRAVCSLARVLADNGENLRALELLNNGYAAFSEGFDTRDLLAGRQLIARLS